MLKMVIVPQLALLLFAWSTQTEDFMFPTVNIHEELMKVKIMDGKLKMMEEMLQNQTNLVTRLNSRVEELEKENKALQTQAQISQDKLQSLQKEDEAMRLMAQTTQNKIGALHQENEARKIAFSASLLNSGTGHSGPFDKVTSPLIYKKVYTNFGNGYNSGTGIFTAPVKGVYYLRFYAHSHVGHKMAVSLYKNAAVQCSVFSWKPTSTNGNASNGIVLILEKGDQIFTKLWDSAWVYDDPVSYTSFGGFLLFPL